MNHDGDGGGGGWQHWALMALCCAPMVALLICHRSGSFSAWSLLPGSKAALA